MKDIVDFLNIENKKEMKHKEDDTKAKKYVIPYSEFKYFISAIIFSRLRLLIPL